MFARSDAAFEIVRQFGGMWRLLLVFKIAPRGWRDWLYAFIVKNRYRWFGRREACMVPSVDIQQRFLT
jgi:predicted DCC family thiol-disulfide oxidoreductase YuxK